MKRNYSLDAWEPAQKLRITRRVSLLTRGGRFETALKFKDFCNESREWVRAEVLGSQIAFTTRPVEKLDKQMSVVIARLNPDPKINQAARWYATRS